MVRKKLQNLNLNLKKKIKVKSVTSSSSIGSNIIVIWPS